MHHDEAQGFGRTLGHGHESAHAQRLDFLETQHLCLDARLAAQLAGGIGEHGRGRVIARPVGPLLGKLHASQRGLPHLKLLAGGREVHHAKDDLAQAARLGAGLGGGVDVGRIRAGQHGSADGRGFRLQQAQHHTQLFQTGGLDQRHGAQNSLAHGRRRTVASPHQNHTRRLDVGRAITHQRFGQTWLQVTLFQHALGQRLQCRWGLGRQGGSVGQQHEQSVDGELVCLSE